MKHIWLIFSAIVFSLCCAGCATTPVGPYEKFANAGINYADSLNQLLLTAQETAIDTSSAQLIETNRFADRSAANFHQQEINSLGQFNELDGERIAVFNDIRKHVSALSGYFVLLNTLATTDEAEKTAEAIAASAKNIDDLSQQLGGQEIFKLSDEQKSSISKIVAFVVNAKQRAALKAAIARDQGMLQSALKTHEELLSVIGDDLEHNTQLLNLRRTQMLLETPLTAKQPLADTPEKAQKWLEQRRRILMTNTAIGELKTASRAAKTLQNTLEKLLGEDPDFATQLLRLMAELQSIREAAAGLK